MLKVCISERPPQYISPSSHHELLLQEFESELKNATDKDIFDEEDGLNPKPKLPQEEQKK